MRPIVLTGSVIPCFHELVPSVKGMIPMVLPGSVIPCFHELVPPVKGMRPIVLPGSVITCFHELVPSVKGMSPDVMTRLRFLSYGEMTNPSIKNPLLSSFNLLLDQGGYITSTKEVILPPWLDLVLKYFPLNGLISSTNFLDCYM
ncbi:Hypothetical predicted protein [Mytilus galloprovincialis]|uniref:Uncharacterized protein n=1 Tax=Mytilus galloprovincialis TaxID=29158 RepID=A0A8B6HSR3_MYTGA|nr:Hypothetical predicted protein [Mytilus galloprovincialis]